MLQRHSPRGIRGMRYLHNTQTETQNRGCSIGDNRHGTFSIFLLHDNSDKNIPKHNKFLNSRKSYACQVLPNGFAGGCLPAYAVQGGIKPLTCTHFDPNIFLIFSKSNSFTLPQQAFNLPLWVTTSTSLLKLHTGATQALTRARESWLACLKIIFVHYYCFFSVFGLWHKANSAHFSGSYEKICSQIKKLTCNCSFSELTSHTTKAIRKSFVSPVFCRMYPSP